MALEGLNTNGAYPVYDTSGSIKTYANLIAQNQAKRANELKSLQEEQSKVKLDGLREADKPIFYQKYNAIKSLAPKIIEEKDPIKKMQLRSEYDRGFLELGDIVHKSKKYDELRTQVNTKALDNDFLDQFDENGWKAWRESDKKSIFDPSIVLDPSTIARNVDIKKLMADLDKIDENVLKGSVWSNPKEVSHTRGNRKGVLVTQERAIDQKEQALRYAMKFDLQPEFKLALRKIYPDLSELPSDQLKEAAIPRLVQERRHVESKAPEFKENDNWKAKKDYEDLLIRRRQAEKGEPKNESILRQEWINDMFNGVPGSGERLKAFVEGTSKLGGKKLGILPKGNEIIFDIPGYNIYENDGKTVKESVPKKRIIIDKTKAADKIKLNEFINEVTGEKINISQLLTEGGKKKISGSENSREIKQGVKQSDVVSFNVNGKRYNIPRSKISSFKQSFPNAKQL